MTSNFQNWIQVAVIICLGILGFSRAYMLRKRKIRVLILNSQMTKIQLINGIVFVVCFLTWIFESMVYGLSLDFHIPSVILHMPLIQNFGIKAGAVLVLILGLLIYALALNAISDSWRIGIDREKPGKLITSGIFAWSRNPIYISLDLLVLGTFLLQGFLLFLILFMCVAVSLHIQILQEEKFLLQTYGEDFSEYCSKTARYFIF